MEIKDSKINIIIIIKIGWKLDIKLIYMRQMELKDLIDLKEIHI